MARTYYDDGSFIDLDSNGDSVAYNTAGVAVSKVEADGDYFRSTSFSMDALEQQRIDPFVARPPGDARPWYERVADYGVPRVIDTYLATHLLNKGAAAGTYAGANGRTYTSAPGAPVQTGTSGVLVLAALAVAAILIVK